MTLTLGAHPQNLSLSLIARTPDLVERLRDHGVNIFAYEAGSQTIQLFQLGALQIGGTGATPPILAAAQNLEVAVFGISDPRPENGGLVVHADSPFHRLADLRGRGISLMPISWHTQFLATELAAAGLRWDDVRAQEVIPATGKEAFVRGLIDAIVLTDPLYGKAAAEVPVRVIAAPGRNFSNRSVYWARRDVIEASPEAVRAVLEALIEVDRRTAADPQEAAQRLAGWGGNSAEQWLPALRARAWGVYEPDAAFLAEQQSHADLFADFGLIPKRVDATPTVDARVFRSVAADVV